MFNGRLQAIRQFVIFAGLLAFPACVVAGIVANVAGAGQSPWGPSWAELLVLSGVVIAGGTMLVGIFSDEFRRRAVARSLRRREPLGAHEFGRRYFGETPNRAALATKLRTMLEAQLRMPLEGLRPADRFVEDLGEGLLGHPELFWEIEEEFGVETPTADLAEYTERMRSIETFRDLVDYVEERSRSDS